MKIARINKLASINYGGGIHPLGTLGIEGITF